MSAVPFSDEALAEGAARLIERITPARARWEYCLSRASYKESRNGEVRRLLNLRTIPVCARILGVAKWRAESSLGQLLRLGFDGALEEAEKLREFVRRRQPEHAPLDPFRVGPMQAWHVGHIYFARVKSHPHVLKVGFSRRVRERLDDIESKCRISLFVEERELPVGTLADEHWWHKNWEKHRISGEWFFDPRSTERELPPFLVASQTKEAA